MVRPSHPRLMARVIDAVLNLGDTKGSSTREIISFIRRNNVSSKNLTVQVQRALKHASAAGLLRHGNGRYKVLATLTPVPDSPSKKPVSNDPKTEEKKLNPARASRNDARSSRKAQERKKETEIRRRSGRRRSNRNTKGKSRACSPSTYKTRSSAAQNRKQRQRKRAHEDEEFQSQSSDQCMHERDSESFASYHRRAKRSKVSKSDLSYESDRESDADRKHLFQASKSQHRESRRKVEVRAKSRDRSASPARSPQQTTETRQHPAEKVENDRERRDEDHGSVKRSETDEESYQDALDTFEANNTLENS